MPKTASSLRQIPLPNAINRHLLQMKASVVAPEMAFFLTGTARLIEPRNYYEKYKRYLKEADLEGFNFHALRHTFATRCIEAGINPAVLQRILGHKNIEITLNTYTSIFNRYKGQEIKKVEIYFSQLH
jgi:integrase